MITYIKAKYFWPIALLLFFGNIFYTQMTPDKYNTRASEIYQSIEIPKGINLIEETHTRITGNGATYTRKYEITDQTILVAEILQKKFRENKWIFQDERQTDRQVIRYRVDSEWQLKVEIFEKYLFIHLDNANKSF